MCVSAFRAHRQMCPITPKPVLQGLQVPIVDGQPPASRCPHPACNDLWLVPVGCLDLSISQPNEQPRRPTWRTCIWSLKYQAPRRSNWSTLTQLCIHTALYSQAYREALREASDEMFEANEAWSCLAAVGVDCCTPIRVSKQQRQDMVQVRVGFGESSRFRVGKAKSLQRIPKGVHSPDLNRGLGFFMQHSRINLKYGSVL